LPAERTPERKALVSVEASAGVTSVSVLSCLSNKKEKIKIVFFEKMLYLAPMKTASIP